jgi:predicted TIM-barrel fold metal-dependent hydrolase
MIAHLPAGCQGRAELRLANPAGPSRIGRRGRLWARAAGAAVAAADETMMTKPSRIIDFHQHVFWHGRDDADMVANLDEHGIEKAVLLNWDITELELTQAYEGVFNPVHARPGGSAPGLPLSDVVRAARRYPDRFIAGYCPYPLGPYAIAKLEAALSMHDVRMCGEWKATAPLDDPRCLNLFRFCGERRLPVLFHIDVPYRPDPQTGRPTFCKEWYGGTIDNLERALAACPETILVGHGPGFWRYISGDADTAPEGYPPGEVTPGGRLGPLLDACPNFYADLSGFSGRNALQRDPEHGKTFLLKYQQRLLFGRDNYDGQLHEFLQSLGLPEDVTENIYHRNAEKLLRMEQ